MTNMHQITHEGPGGVPDNVGQGSHYLSQDDWRMVGVSPDGGWDILRKVWRRKGLVMAMAAGFLVVGAGVAVLLTPRYTAISRILVGIEEPHVTNVESVLKGITPNLESVQSEAYVVESRELARKVGYQLALDQSPEFNLALRETQWYDYLNPARLFDFRAMAKWFRSQFGDDTVERAASDISPKERMWQRIDDRLLDRVDVTPLNRSHVLELAATSEEPVTAAKIANAFGDLYVEDQLARKRQATTQADEWLNTRIKEMQGKVQEAERAVEAYRREKGLYATKNDTVVAQQLGSLNQSLLEAENARAQAQSNLAQAQSLKNPENADALPQVLQSPTILMLKNKQSDLEKDQADLLSQYTDKHPKVASIKAQLADNRAKVREEVKRIIDGLQQEERVANERVTRAQQRMNQIQNKVGQSNEESVTLNELDRVAEAQRGMLESLLKRSSEMVEQRGLQTADSAVISRAGVPLLPSFPPTNLVMVLAAFVGIGAGVLLALLLENLDQTFRTSEELEEYLGMPAMALLPRVEKSRRQIGHVVRNPYSTFTDGLRMLSARLTLGQEGDALPKLIMFTSALPAEGKSFSSSAFAQLLAMDGRRVIILDLDWKKPNLHRLFGQRPGPGIVDLLNRDITPEQAVYHDPQSGADVMFAGNVGQVRGMSTRIEWLRLLLHTLSRHYDVVILDAPPVMFSPEVLHLAPLVDKTILAVKWGTTPRRVVAAELKSLLRAGVRQPGIILTQVDPKRYDRYSYEDSGFFRHRYLVNDGA
jgi:succinoglycan biosynthesis transport protein ExoP